MTRLSNAAIWVQLDVPLMVLRDGNRVMAKVSVEVHSTQPLPGDSRALVALACEKAKQRIQLEIMGEA